MQSQWFGLLSDLLTVGFSMGHAMAFLTTAQPKSAFVSRAVSQTLASGQSLAYSLKPYISADLYYQLLLAETHGNLRKALAEISEFLRARQAQRKKLIGLLQYPLLLLILLGGMMVALEIFVFPEIRQWQASNTRGQPLSTHWLMLIVISLVGGVAGSGLGWVIRFWRSSAPVKAKMLCALPIVGKSCRLYYGYYLVSNIAVMLRHGMSLREVAQVTSGFAKGSLLQAVGQAIQKTGTEGEGLVDLMKKTPYVPDELVIFLNKGESQRQLGADLGAFGRIQFRRLLTSLEHLLVFVQPVVFALIALVIIWMYLSLLLPIYQSLQGVY